MHGQLFMLFGFFSLAGVTVHPNPSHPLLYIYVGPKLMHFSNKNQKPSKISCHLTCQLSYVAKAGGEADICFVNVVIDHEYLKMVFLKI